MSSCAADTVALPPFDLNTRSWLLRCLHCKPMVRCEQLRR